MNYKKYLPTIVILLLIALGAGATTWSMVDISLDGILTQDGNGTVTAITAGTNGQLMIGSTGADPAFTTLNCDSNLTCTTGAGTLEIDVNAISNFATSLSVASSSPSEALNVVGAAYINSGTTATTTISGGARICVDASCTAGMYLTKDGSTTTINMWNDN